MVKKDDLIAPRFDSLDASLRYRMVKRLLLGWPATREAPRPGAIPSARMEKIFDAVQRCCCGTMSEEAFPSLIHVSEMVFGNQDGDLLTVNERGVARVNDVIYRISGSLFLMLRPVLQDFGFEDGAPGISRMMALLCQYLESSKHVDMLARSLYSILMGGEEHTDIASQTFTERYTSHMTWMGIYSGTLSYNAIFIYYLQHLGLPPMERRSRSIPRTMAFLELVLQPILDHTGDWRKPRVHWVLAASNSVEGQSARDGYFEDVGALRDPKVTVCLIGEDLPHELAPFAGCTVEVQGYGWHEISEYKVPNPTMVFALNTGLGSFNTASGGLMMLILSLTILPTPPLIVMTCRCETEAHVENAVLRVLGARTVMPSKHQDHTRNLFSGMAGHPDVDFDDNGWWVAVLGTYLPPEMHEPAKEFACDPQAVYAKAREDLASRRQPEEEGPPAEQSADAAPPAVGEAPAEAAPAEKAPAETAPAETAPAEAAPAETAPAEAPAPAEEGDGRATVDQALAPDKQPSCKSSAVFWGILDLKYDPRRHPRDHVKVLETGDGRTSRFSGWGAAIKETFQQDHQLQETLHRAVLTENKKLTHDTIVDCSYEHLRPRQFAFYKEYTPTLAIQIWDSFGFGEHDTCVLKLCNRTRGAGVIPVPVMWLDDALRELLTPPTNVQLWLQEQPKDWVRTVAWGCHEEQVRHWWSNECPVFIVEELCCSMPIEKEGQHFDGTMRVGFSLHREERLKPQVQKHRSGEDEGSDNSEEEDEQLARSQIMAALQAQNPEKEPLQVWDKQRPYLELFRTTLSVLRVQWLGGYWKLPIEDTTSQNLREKVVSVAKQGTAPVETCQLHEVYTALGDMVARLFEAKDMSNPNLLKRYSDNPEFGAFVISRLACSMRARDRAKCHGLLQLAKTNLMAKANLTKVSSCARDLVESYIIRNFGVHQALQGSWSAAQEEFERALKKMPTNATARFLVGIAHMEQGDVKAAITAMEESLLLDPDFKAPYAGISALRLRRGEYRQAAEWSRLGLTRHPYTPQCSYNLGLANFALACQREEAAALARSAVLARQARESQATASSASRPANAKPVRALAIGVEERYEVVHSRVLVRGGPTRDATVVGVAVKGRPIYAVPNEAAGEAWLHLGRRTCEELRLQVTDAWMMMDGGYLGLGPLLKPVEAPAGGEVVVTVRHEEQEKGQVHLRIPVESTIGQVRAALARELGKSHFPMPLFRKVGTEFARCLDSERLGTSFELTVRGKAYLPRFSMLPAATPPRVANGAGANVYEAPASRASTALPMQPGGVRGWDPGVALVAPEAEPDAEGMALREDALQALEAARTGRTRDLPWTERDDALLARLRAPGPLAWPAAELPREGWRVLNFRP